MPALVIGMQSLSDVRSAIFAIAALSWVLPAAAQPGAAAQREPGWVDKLLNMVGPAEPRVLTRRQQAQQYLLNMVGPTPILSEAAGAGISQWRGTPEAWGQGADGYAKRFGSNVAYNAIRQTVSYGLSVPFGEDNRYFASRSTRVLPRLRHALISPFTARHADGRTTFSVSGTSGVIAASAISSTWGPSTWKGAGIARNAGLSFASTAGFSVVREFLADILHRKR
jgi:hypothetical protein